MRNAAPALAPQDAHGLGLDIVLGHGRGAGGFECRGDGEKAVEGGQTPGLGRDEIHEILDLARAVGGERLNLLDERSGIGHGVTSFLDCPSA
jgi:hypothetical protein